MKFNFRSFKFIKNKKLTKVLAMILAIVLIIIAGLIFIKVKQAHPKKTNAVDNIPASNFPYKDFGLEIDKLNIKAPVIADVPADNKEMYFKSLEKGVAHMQGTKKPGESGLIFIFGHSSFYPWSAGDYKEIFKDLDDLAVGDEFSVWYQQKQFKYKIEETKIILPTDVDILKPTDFERLIIMTCWPPKTIEKRMIIIAKPL